ncbi:hypothetical protein LUZ60_009490 [Juncus effusus]|nr:hypothetical protein LUZ60_009490 [Juncus effusus]
MERISSELSLNSHRMLSKIIPYYGPTCDLASDPNHGHCEMTTDRALKNISSMLFEENNDENNDVYPEEASLQAMEKSFYDILGQNYPSSHGNLPQPNWKKGYATSDVTFSDSNHDISLPIVKFNKGLEEGMKFLPTVGENKSTFDLQGNNKLWFTSNSKENSNLVGKNVKEGEEQDRGLVIVPGKRQTNFEDLSMLRGQRHVDSGDLSLMEGRKCKISEIYFNNRDEAFDKILLLHEELYVKEAIRLRKIKQTEIKLSHKKETNENLVDLRILLMQCAQTISMNDIQSAHELIKQIRKHSSPDGNGYQRMAHIFVNGLEARLNGIDGELHQQLIVPQENMIDHLNTFHMSLIASPFLFASQYFANHTILNAIKKGSKLHIIHMGIEYGFHWPFLIHALSQRKGGPPKLRITGIDGLTPGFSYTARLEAIGKRLEGYARIASVPFEYRGIGAKWDEICIEDLNIEKDEVLIVNCLQGLAFLGDETDVMYSPKNQFLEIIRRIKPNIFIQGILNGSYRSPFFVDRFKQVLLHHSAMFDLLDNNIPRGNNKLRWYLENDVLGRAAINVIACEGSKRFLRSETYKQWHVRNLRSGYNQFPLDHAIIKQIKNMVSEAYDKDFFVENDDEWLLWGWKGRVIGAISTWQPRET